MGPERCEAARNREHGRRLTKAVAASGRPRSGTPIILPSRPCVPARAYSEFFPSINFPSIKGRIGKRRIGSFAGLSAGRRRENLGHRALETGRPCASISVTTVRRIRAGGVPRRCRKLPEAELRDACGSMLEASPSWSGSSVLAALLIGGINRPSSRWRIGIDRRSDGRNNLPGEKYGET
jgi:hypothetical protein